MRGFIFVFISCYLLNNVITQSCKICLNLSMSSQLSAKVILWHTKKFWPGRRTSCIIAKIWVLSCLMFTMQWKNCQTMRNSSISCWVGKMASVLLSWSLLTIRREKISKEDMYEKCNIGNNSNSDFLRLYFIISCCIPFECISKTKRLYRRYKENKIYTIKKKDNSKILSYLYKGIISAVPLLPVLGLLGYIKNK